MADKTDIKPEDENTSQEPNGVGGPSPLPTTENDKAAETSSEAKKPHPSLKARVEGRKEARAEKAEAKREAREEGAEASAAPGTGDAAPKKTSDKEGSIFDAGKKAAGTAGAHFSKGFSAMREVHAASKQHGTARSRMESIQEDLNNDQATLDHRNDVESHFDSIIAEQTAEREDAQKSVDAAQSEIDQLTKTHDDLTRQLEKMKADHEQQLRPYKNLAESTRSRADDAGKALAEAKRAVRTAESQVSEATNRRETRLAAANKAVDNAQARLQKLESELSDMKKNSGTGIKPLSEMNSTVAAEKAHLDTARADVQKATDETQKLVDNAQTHLWTQRQSLEQAEKAADTAKKEASERKEEYDKLLQDAETEEATLDNEAVAKEMRARDVGKDLKAAQDRVDAAQALIDEANDIHANPGTTAGLAERVSDEKSALAVQQQQVDMLAETERELRDRTRQERGVFIAIVVAVAVIVLLVLWLIFGAH